MVYVIGFTVLVMLKCQFQVLQPKAEVNLRQSQANLVWNNA